MPGPTIDPINPDTQLPDSVEVVVIGGGIIGCATALELAERGVRVLVLEKGVIAGEQSSRNWGWVRMSRRDPREIELMEHAIRLWEELADRVGMDVGYRQCGIVAPFYSDSFKQDNLNWLDQVDGERISMNVIDAKACRALVPDLDVEYTGALHSPKDGRAEPQKAAPAIARAVQARGGKVIAGCAVRTIEMNDGRVSGVMTERGRVATSKIVVAGGAWTRLILRDIGVALPQLKVLNSVCRTEPVAEGPDITIRGPNFAARRRADGGYSVAAISSNTYDLTPDSFRFLPTFAPILRREWRTLRPRLNTRFLQELGQLRRRSPDEVSVFEETRILDPAPTAELTAKAAASLARADERFRGVRIAQHWAGLIDVTPDAVPVISTVPEREGLVVATGFSGHGFGLSLGAGRLAADLANGDTPTVDPTAFRFSRFSDGSPIRPLTGF